MLGARVDAHPGSRDGRGDALHFCCPGPLDYALDLVVARVGAAFRRPPPAPAGAFDLNHETAKMLAASNRGARIDRAIGELRYAAPATSP